MKLLKYCVKIVLAGIVAFSILCGAAAVYSLTPMRVENKYGNTDYVWESEKLWMKMSEGISCGLMDAKGFNNLHVIDNPDVLLLGSSHIEGMNVLQKEHTVNLLNDKFDGRIKFYNMGISGHTLFKVVQYLEKSILAFETVPNYIVIESSTTVLSETDVENALNKNVEVTTVNSEGLIAKLQKFPFLRQVYHQLDSGMMDMLLPSPVSSNDYSDSQPIVEEPSIDEHPYEDFFMYIKSVEEKYSTQIVIMYHPFESINKDGTISFSNGEYTSLFADYAHKNNIDFIDMTNSFENMYYNEYQVPHGFCTGELGSGHINKYAHKAMADELCAYFSGIKEDE